jgi:hypothetical protein
MVLNASRVGNDGVIRYIIPKFFDEYQALPSFNAFVPHCIEIILRRDFVFPPWRLLMTGPMSYQESNELALKRGLHIVQVDDIFHLVHPPPFGPTTQIPAHVHPEIILGEGHEKIIKTHVRKKGLRYDDVTRLFLGKVLTVEEQLKCIKFGYVTVKSLEGGVRAVFPLPLSREDKEPSIGGKYGGDFEKDPCTRRLEF